MGDAEFIKVMQVSKAEDDRREEDGSGEAGPSPEQQRNGRGAKQTFFGYRALVKGNGRDRKLAKNNNEKEYAKEEAVRSQKGLCRVG